jgi:hypothetical protein
MHSPSRSIFAALLLTLVAAATLMTPGRADAATRFFAPDGIWNNPLPANAPLDPSSATYVHELGRLAAPKTQGGYGSSIMTTSYGVPIYTVPANQPLVRVTLDQANSPLLSSALQSVPIPASALPAAGTDGNMAIWQPATDTMWEFWRIVRKTDGWHAGYGGKKSNVSTDPGVYRDLLAPDGVNFTERCFWGAPSSKFPLVAGVMTIAELRSGVIPHALAVALPEARAGVWSAPAQGTDGRTASPTAIPIGARFRLDPNLNIDALNLPPVVRAMAHAAQTYGIVVNNMSGGVGFRAEDPAQYGVNPYPDLFGGTQPSLLMRKFPWDKLQMLPMSLRSGSCSSPTIL